MDDHESDSGYEWETCPRCGEDESYWYSWDGGYCGNGCFGYDCGSCGDVPVRGYMANGTWEIDTGIGSLDVCHDCLGSYPNAEIISIPNTPGDNMGDHIGKCIREVDRLVADRHRLRMERERLNRNMRAWDRMSGAHKVRYRHRFVRNEVRLAGVESMIECKTNRIRHYEAIVRVAAQEMVNAR